MNVVCYAYRDENGSLISPFMEYVDVYRACQKDTPRQCAQKAKRLINIFQHIEFAADNNGAYFLSDIVELYKDTSIAILKMKEGDHLVRIAFFTLLGESLVLLGAYDKPKLYEKGKKRRVDKKIKKFLLQMEEYRQDFLKNSISIPFPLDL